MIDCYRQAFGLLDPHHDRDVSAKFALSVLVMDECFDELADLITDGNDVGALEGEPGWIIERRDSGPSGQMPGYADWPDGKAFRAFVDPAAFALAYPEVFLDTATFRGYVRRLMDACLLMAPNNARARMIRDVL